MKGEGLSIECEWFGRTLPKELKFVELFGLADYHLGNPFSDKPCWDRALEYILYKPEAYAILVGDLCECVVVGSKGDIHTQTLTPGSQRDQIIKDLRPLAEKGKLLGATTGNHEERIYERTGLDLTKDIAEKLGVPYDPDGIFLRVDFGDKMHRESGRPYRYWVYASHGFGGARTKGAKAVKVERLAQYVMCDVAMMAHDHESNLSPAESLTPDNDHFWTDESGYLKGAVRAHNTVLVKCSAFLKWGGYARRKDWGPSRLVMPAVLLGGEEKPWPMAHPKMKNECEVRGVL